MLIDRPPQVGGLGIARAVKRRGSTQVLAVAGRGACVAM